MEQCSHENFFLKRVWGSFEFLRVFLSLSYHCYTRAVRTQLHFLWIIGIMDTECYSVFINRIFYLRICIIHGQMFICYAMPCHAGYCNSSCIFLLNLYPPIAIVTIMLCCIWLKWVFCWSFHRQSSWLAGAQSRSLTFWLPALWFSCASTLVLPRIELSELMVSQLLKNI